MVEITLATLTFSLVNTLSSTGKELSCVAELSPIKWNSRVCLKIISGLQFL